MVPEHLDAPEFKYTDRHIREDPDLRTWAEAYVDSYGGDFEPMINAKREFWRDRRLSVRTARVVLNCARHDQSVMNRLPQPKPPILKLVEIEKDLPPFCDDVRPHHAHGKAVGKSRKWMECPGVPWEINRGPFSTIVRVKARFAAAHSSSIYHRTSGKGERIWHPPAHTMGPAASGGFYVDLVCKYPSIIKEPLLFMEEPTTLLSAIARIPGYRTRCSNGCFE